MFCRPAPPHAFSIFPHRCFLYLPAISQLSHSADITPRSFPHKMEAEAHFLNWNEHSISAESGCVNHTQH